MSDATSSSWVIETLQNESTKKYFIEYATFRSNHMAHGIIALNRLGASETRIKHFVDVYGATMEPPSFSSHQGENPDAKPADEQRLKSLLGKRTDYYAIYNNYKPKLVDTGSLTLFIQKEFPKLIRGMFCSALHGLIHTGYGYSAGSSTIVGEGIAYLHHSFIPFTFEEINSANDIKYFGRGNSDILEILKELKSNVELRKQMLDMADDLAKSSWVSGRFQYRVAALMKEAGDQILKYANKVKIPVIADKSDVDDVDTIQVSDWLLHQAIAVYTFADRKNDFFLLHGVTGAWSLKQIIPVLKHVDAMDALRTYTCVLLAAYVAQDAPELITNQELPNKSNDENIWKEIIGETLSCDRDEHIFKLIQVVHDVWCENNNSDYGALCVEAAKSCLGNELSFIKLA